MDPLGLFAFPCAGKDMNRMPPGMRGYGCRQAIFLKAAERVVVVEDKSDFHF